MVGQRILEWYDEANRREFPWRHTTEPFHILVSEMLLHQTFARKVVPVYRALVERYPTPMHFSRARTKTVREMIRPLGFLYRADRLKAIGKKLVDDFSGAVPRDERGLLSLPGVGPYTANAVRCFGFEEQVPIVDTNVLRVYRRAFSTAPHSTGLGPDKASVEVAKEALPEGRARAYNYAILDFAALVCTHYNPGCASCPLLEACDYGQETFRSDAETLRAAEPKADYNPSS